MINKKDLRKKAREIRKSLDLKTISEIIVSKVLAMDSYKQAKNIMIFYPLENEIDLRELLNDKTKQFYLPKVNGEKLLVCPYKKGDELFISSFKTLEPTTKPIENSDILDIIFVPALMADKDLNRLGYGGGFYDRFLSTLNKKTKKIVVISKELIIDKIPFDSFDEIVDIVITD